jgi:hypothetical protein
MMMKNTIMMSPKLGMSWLGAMVGLALAGCCCPAPTTTSSDNVGPTKAAAVEPELPPATIVASTKLFSDYEANEVSADAKYKDKRLSVRGQVVAIDKDFMDNVVLKLKGGRYKFNSVSATLKGSDAAKAGNLKKGEDVTVWCTGGGRIVGSPVLRKCTLQ